MKSSIFASFWFKLFVALSLADLGLTSWLLSAHPEWVVESNPVADWWLARFGLMGLVFIKAASVSLLAGVLYWLARLRPNLSRGVMAVGCLILLGVVGYSISLAKFLDHNTQRIQAIVQQEQKLDQTMAKMIAYNKAVDQVYRNLQTNQTTLKQAVESLMQTEHVQKNVLWANQLKYTYESDSLAVSMAKSLMMHFQVNISPENQKVLQRLEEQLEVEFPAELLTSSRSDWTAY